MTPLTWALVALLAVLGFWSVGAYNRLMSLRNAISEAFAELDRQLSQRAQVCEQLVTQVKPLLPNEQATFDALANAQAEAQAAALAARGRPWSPDTVGALAVATSLHGAAQARLMSLLEHASELHDAAGLGALMDELKLVERQRAFARQVFNQTVERYNEAIAQIPTRALARLYRFTAARPL
ncbi:LemA family protein [Roseateles paludis]|jgi:LemA protein|uniref:LemA family protein n=1 Tax=Roseateles paludis TaxID=3145238 RepID=A0ABV0G767_9BURK